MANQFEVRISKQMGNITFAPAEKIVQAQYVISILYQAITQMRSEETGSTGDKNPFSVVAHTFLAPTLTLPVPGGGKFW